MNQCLEEIIYYCKQEHHAGGLLLTGKWGSGKTYLLKNELTKQLKDTHSFVFVSLFGISNIEELKKTTKIAWVQQSGTTIDVVSKAQKVLSKAAKIAEPFDKTKASKVVSSILASNLLDFISIKNEVNNKKVVLVFDDLERTSIGTKDALGAINDFSENQSFPVIIVANQEKIAGKSSDNDISYNEIKEKIIQRTIYLEPNYETIIPTIIDELTDGEYHEFLKAQEKTIISLLCGYSPDGTKLDDIGIHNAISRTGSQEDKEDERKKLELLKKRPHNIRIVKVAILDFERIFQVLCQNNIQKKEAWFFTFLVSEILIRNNLTEKNSDYKWIFFSRDLSVLYPGYYQNQCLVDFILDWIAEGIWDDEYCKKYFEDIAELERRKSDAFFQVKNQNISLLDETWVETEYPKIIELGYAGKLNLSEYITAIVNSANAREVDYELPCQIDWPALEEGIYERLRFLLSNNADDNLYEIKLALNKIFHISQSKFSDQEKHALAIISNCEKDQELHFPYIKNQFLQYLDSDPEGACRYLIGQSINRIDEDMVSAIADAFESADNAGKRTIVSEFTKMLRNLVSEKEFVREQTEHSLIILKEKLDSLLHVFNNKAFAKYYTKQFLNGVQECLDEIAAEQADEGEQAHERI